MKKLKLQFLAELDYYLKVEKLQKQVAVNKEIQRLRRLIKVAVAEGYLERDPFILHKNKKVTKLNKNNFQPTAKKSTYLTSN